MAENRRNKTAGFEENMLALIDGTGPKDSRDSRDDSIAYLEAVRAASVVPEDGIPPTNKMYEAVYKILRFDNSLELIMASYQLLKELNKLFPRVYISKSLCNDEDKIDVVEEVWSPFVCSTDVSCNDSEAAGTSGLFDSFGFQKLIQDLGELCSETHFQTSDTNSLRNMLLLQYLVDVLVEDFVPRNRKYTETMTWKVMKESLLNILLASRRINYKGLLKDCLYTLCTMYHVPATKSCEVECPMSSQVKISESHDKAVEFGFFEVQKSTSMAMNQLLRMIMELDTSKKKADLEGITTRADGVRTSSVDLILDELTYSSDMVNPFLQVFNDPKWKLELVVQYFSKYMAKPSVRTRRSNPPTEDPTFSSILKCFLNSASTRNITKKINVEMVQLLLAHAFQAQLSISSQYVGDIPDLKERSSLVEICKNITSAFDSLRQIDKNMEILPFGKEALFTAATILSINS